MTGATKSLGSFADWSQRVCKPLVWLGCGDPSDTVERARDSDPERDALILILARWETNLPLNATFHTQEIIERTVNCAAFFNALISVAPSRGGLIDNKRLGWWLKRVEGKIVNGLSISSDGNFCGSKLWKLTRRS